jgi:transcriptional regulator with XRE-family HTH domain
MDHTIGQNIRTLRAALAWTQEHLATVTGLSARTIQRLEDGGPASPESLLALAAAFGVSVEDLRRPPEQQVQMEAQAAELLKKAQERYAIIPLERVERASSMTRALPVEAILCQHVDLRNDAEEDAVAALDGYVRDLSDVWTDVGPSSRRDIGRELQQIVDQLKTLGLIVASGTHWRRLRFSNGKSDPFSVTTLYIMISRANEPKLFLALDKKAPVQFT